MMRYLGYVGGSLLCGFGILHSVMGWPALVRELGDRVPSAIVTPLAVPWHFAGLAMVLIGALGIGSSAGRLNPAMAVMVAGGATTLFGLMAAVMLRSPAFLFVFALPGLLIAASAAVTMSR